MKNLDTLLEGSAAAHGHMCPGQVVGVRMAMEGCRLIGLDNPGELPQIKKLIVFVEMDRCATDAISYVTGAKLGRRSLKFVNYGIMAATFVNLETGQAFRLVSRESARTLAGEYAPDAPDAHQQQVEAYKQMDRDTLFVIEEVQVDVEACDMPGPTRFKAVCQKCGQVVRDKREVMKNGQILCRPCTFGAYYKPVGKKGSRYGKEQQKTVFHNAAG